MTAPGDLVFCHSRGAIGSAIRLGERLRFRAGDFYNHVAIIDRPAPGNDWYVIQAESRGVTNDKLLSSIAPGGTFTVVPCPVGVLANRLLAFARAQVGSKYGFVTIGSLAADIISPRWLRLPTFRFGETWICSALGAESLRAGGWIHSWSDVYQVVPSELFAALSGLTVRQADAMGRHPAKG